VLIIERQQRVASILAEHGGSLALEDLARELGVSTSTIRRDLETLEAQGVVERTHGGAILREATPTSRMPLNARLGERVEAKQRIARCVADLVQPHMTLLLDGGSTVIYAARALTARPLQVVTNSLAIANLFADDDQVELLLVGGNLYPRTGVTVGPFATAALSDLHADLLLFSLAGIYDDGAYNISLPMAQVEQVMLRQAAESLLLMDASKFGRKSLVRVCGLSEVDQVVTDTGVDDAWRDRLGDRLRVAPDP